MSILDGYDFRKISPEANDDFANVLSNFDCYSDFSLLSLLIWDDDNVNHYAVIKDKTLIIRISDYINKGSAYGLIGYCNIGPIIENLRSNGARIKYLPSFLVPVLNNKYLLREDRDGFDYVKDINKHMAGYRDDSFYKNFRIKLRVFEEKNPNLNFKFLDTTKPEVMKSIEKLARSWCKEKSFSSSEEETNLVRLGRFFKYQDKFKTLSYGFTEKDEIVSCVINEIFYNPNWAVGQLGYSLRNYENLSYGTEHFGIRALQEQGIKFLNLEQDTGIVGLRTYKMNLAPEFFLKKYYLDGIL